MCTGWISVRHVRADAIRAARVLRAQGASDREIMRRLHIGRNTISKYLGAVRGRSGISDEALQRARELEAQGYKRAEITRMTGISGETLRKYLGARGRKTVSSEQIARMHELRARGWSRSRIAREVGCADVTVADHLGGYRKMDAPSRQQLCWSCARSAAGKDRQCSWDARLQPVDGLTIDKDGFVVSCPEFEEAKR